MACVVLEGIQLGPDFIADLGRAEHAQPAAHDERAHPQRLQQERVLREIQVQSGFGQAGVQTLELWSPLRPCRRAYHAADGLRAADVRKLQRRLTHPGMQTEVVHGDTQVAAMLSGFMRSRFPIRPAKLLKARSRIAWFVLVGTAAAAVHWGMVVMLVEHAGWRPLLANVLGWLIAFGVSFSGHHRWTFRAHGVPVWRSALRFFALSAAGFTVNEAVYALLLHWGGLRYDLVLAGVLVVVAGGTYVLSRHWAFKHNRAR